MVSTRCEWLHRRVEDIKLKSMSDGVWLPPGPDTSGLITEDDTPVDNLASEKNQRLLAGSLNASWRRSEPFLAAANVGIFEVAKNPAIVPDLFVALGVELPPNRWAKDDPRSYFIWEMGTPPHLVIELVSNREGGELTRKLERYARMRISHYVVYDPGAHLGPLPLRAFSLRGPRLEPVMLSGERVEFPDLELAVGPWEGPFEGQDGIWLRFFDLGGHVLLSPDERATMEQARADEEAARADNEKARADNEKARADDEKARADEASARVRALEAHLQSLGVELE